MTDKPNLEKPAQPASNGPTPAQPGSAQPTPATRDPDAAIQTTPQAPASPPRPQGASLQRPIIISGLYLLNLFSGFTVFIGVVLAYIWRGEDTVEEWEASHFTYLIRTFWIGFAQLILVFGGWVAAIMGLAITQAGQNEPPSPMFFVVVFGGFLVLLLGAAWFCGRCIVSMVKSANRKPMPNPETWLF